MQKDLELLKSAGILNPNLTIDQLIKAGEQMGVANPGSKVAWELISKDFVLRGKDFDMQDGQIQRPIIPNIPNIINKNNPTP